MEDGYTGEASHKKPESPFAVGDEKEYERIEQNGYPKIKFPMEQSYSPKGGRDEGMVQTRMDRRTALMQACENARSLYVGGAIGNENFKEAVHLMRDEYNKWLSE